MDYLARNVSRLIDGFDLFLVATGVAAIYASLFDIPTFYTQFIGLPATLSIPLGGMFLVLLSLVFSRRGDQLLVKFARLKLKSRYHTI